jgi:hypothetical protein
MMHFKDTEVSYSPMMREEIEYWLSKGNNIFEHRGVYWMRVLHFMGHRIMIHVPEEELVRVRPQLYTKTGKIFRGVQ